VRGGSVSIIELLSIIELRFVFVMVFFPRNFYTYYIHYLYTATQQKSPASKRETQHGLYNRTGTGEGETGTNTRDLDAAVLLSSFANGRRTTEGNGHVNIGAHLEERISNVGSRRVGLPPPPGVCGETVVRPGNADVALVGPREGGQGVSERETTRERTRRANEMGIRKGGKKWVKTYAQRCEAELPHIQRTVV